MAAEMTVQVEAINLLVSQFHQSERADPAMMRALQLQQIRVLAAHAYERSPFWRARFDGAGCHPGSAPDEWFHQLPILTRNELKAAGNTALATPTPTSHGSIGYVKTSGSTGNPLEIAKTELDQIFWMAITLRESIWHKRDFRGKLCAIRVGAESARDSNWGPATAGYVTGQGVTFDARRDIDAQIEWLRAEQPNILLTHASNLRALAQRSLELGFRMPQLREARSFSECLAPDTRDLVRRAWAVPLTDMYTANEVGYIALQCPVSGLYHVQSEDVLVEVINDAGKHCAPGETGRVVVTSLHNFAMPFIRYALGDHAVVGGICPCGRTLPTLERILGRTRNMLRLPGGGKCWPGFPMNTLVDLDAIQELKMIQHSLTDIEVELVLRRPLTSAEEERLTDAVRIRLLHPFPVRLTSVAEINRGNSYKREDFECRMT